MRKGKNVKCLEEGKSGRSEMYEEKSTELRERCKTENALKNRNKVSTIVKNVKIMKSEY